MIRTGSSSSYRGYSTLPAGTGCVGCFISADPRLGGAAGGRRRGMMDKLGAVRIPTTCYCPKCALRFQGYWNTTDEALAEHYAGGCAGEHAERLVARFEAAIDRLVATLA